MYHRQLLPALTRIESQFLLSCYLILDSESEHIQRMLFKFMCQQTAANAVKKQMAYCEITFKHNKLSQEWIVVTQERITSC